MLILRAWDQLLLACGALLLTIQPRLSTGKSRGREVILERVLGRLLARLGAFLKVELRPAECITTAEYEESDNSKSSYVNGVIV